MATKRMEMPHFRFERPIEQLEKRKGGYYYVKVDAEIINQYEKKGATRLKCAIDHRLSYSCELNHFGDGNFFIIIAGSKLKILGKNVGDRIMIEISEDPDPLGVEVPEVLNVLLQQDEKANAIYNKLTDGKKRSLIHSVNRVKDIDKQVEKILKFLNEQNNKSR